MQIVKLENTTRKNLNNPATVNVYPTTCNICGGKVIYTTNDKVYGKKYGSGYCYLCTNCGAYVGTHKPMPKVALGLLANAQMRKGKMLCHDIFDSFWKGKKRASVKRKRLYKYLAYQLNIPPEYSHFGYFDVDMLRKAYKELLKWKSNGIDWNEIQKTIEENESNE